MSYKKIFSALIWVVISFHCSAQLPLTGFITGLDSCAGENLFNAYVSGGSGSYKFKWSHPEITGPVDDSSQAFTLYNNRIELPLEYDIYCTVTDQISKDSIRMKRHIVNYLYDGFSIQPAKDDNVTGWMFTDTDVLLTFGVYNFMLDLSGLEITAEGNGSQYIKPVKSVGPRSSIDMIFNSPVPGNFEITFLLKDGTGAVRNKYTSRFAVKDKSEKICLIMNDKYVSGQNIEPWVFLAQSYSSGFLRITTTDTSTNDGVFGIWLGKASGKLIRNVDRIGTNRPGSYELKGKLFAVIDSVNRDTVEFTRSYVVAPPPVVSVSSAEGCLDQIVTVAVTINGLTEDFGIYLVDAMMEYNADGLLPVSIRTPGRDKFLGIHSTFTRDNLRGFQFNYWNRLGGVGDGDTLMLIDFRIIGHGEHSVAFRNYENPDFNVVASNGVVSVRNKAAFSSAKVTGLPLTYQFEPVYKSRESKYQWDFSFTGSTQVSPVCKFSESGKKYKVCLEVTDEAGCFDAYCDSVETEKISLYSISGKLSDIAFNPLQGKIYAYQIKDNKYIPSGMDMCRSDGSFSIGALEAGTYVLLGLPLDSVILGGYYFGEGLRSDADVIKVTGNVSGIDFRLARKTEMDGSFVTGSFSKDSLTLFYEKIINSSWGEFPSVVFLTNEKGDIINWTFLEKDNTYRLKNLSQDYVLVASYARVSDELTEKFLLTSLKGLQPAVFRLSPNPFSDRFIVEASEEVILECVNSSGFNIFTKKLPIGSEVISTDQLPSGNYVIRITGKTNCEIIKVLKF